MACSFKKKSYLYFICMGVCLYVCMYVYVPCMCLVFKKPEEDVRSPETGVADNLSCCVYIMDTGKHTGSSASLAVTGL